MTIHFTSDTHFGHKFVSELRGFDTPEQMNDVLVEKWNTVVGERDIVFHLGDAVMGGFDKNSHYISKLNGYKILISGNHDRPFYGLKNYKGKEEKYLAAGFDEVYHGQPEYLNFDNIGDVTVCHFPYEQDERHEERYNKFHPEDEGEWLLHGHVHDLWRVRGRQINVGVDVWDGYPVDEGILGNVIDNPDSWSDFTPWTARLDTPVAT